MSPDSGSEYNVSGNVHATGGLIKLREFTEHRMTDSTTERITEYTRDGLWTMYFDTDSLLVRSQGEFEQGKKTGVWKFYIEHSNQPYLIRTYAKGLIKNETSYSESGEIIKQESKSDFELFLIENYHLLILLALLPITLIRISSNIITYNKIYDTKYIPGVHKWQKGGFGVNLYTTFIFWWINQRSDESVIKKAKRISNIISIFSVIIFWGVMILLKIYNLPSN